jgi:sodium/hydrogen exchanger 8
MVDTGGSSWHQTNRGVSIYIAIYLVLFILVTTLSKVLHARPHISSILPEAGMVIAVGIIAGLIINLSTDTDNYGEAGDAAASVLSFSPTVFFVVLLPPIIFNSGYHLHRDLFFRHAVPICLYACVGTTICTFVVAGLLYAVQPMLGFSASFLELAAFGALISATDPVSTLAIFETKKVDVSSQSSVVRC